MLPTGSVPVPLSEAVCEPQLQSKIKLSARHTVAYALEQEPECNPAREEHDDPNVKDTDLPSIITRI
jgi:hypothetical protein